VIVSAVTGMPEQLLDILRCPYCGTRLDVVENDALVREAGAVEWGVLGCECCAYPVIAGIPVLIADDRTRNAMHTLESGRREEALFAMLDLDGARLEAFRALLARGEAATYREALGILSRDAEGFCFLYRFSDPTYLVAEAMLTALGGPLADRDEPFLDLCSGSGHVTRVLTKLAPRCGTIAADLFYWKLWLAKRFVAPESQPVCCDANAPLPFARERCALVVLADAFPYIWHKRLLAGEMVRLTSPGGLIVMPHLHSSLGWNYSQGDALTPAAYRGLFEPLVPRLFSDTQLRSDLLEKRVIDLGADRSPESLGGEASFSLVAYRDSQGSQGSQRSRVRDVFRRHEVSDDVGPPRGELIVNPLYRIEQQESRSVLTLEFPTPEYADEFGECRGYLPDTLTIDAPVSRRLEAATLRSNYEEFRRRRIVIDAPRGYC
jgi:uncharacterized protein YbaR (Trm112 family)/SAM-dependent methyltransferase